MRYMWFFLLIFLSCSLAAQKKDIIQGKVVDQQKNPVPFVSVVVSQNNKQICGTTADVNGNYILEIPDSLKTFVLSYSFVGMQKKEMKVNRKTKKQ